MTDTRANAISALLDPRSIAIVGASENVARIGGRPLRYLRESGFKGAVYPVNPNRDNVQGFKAYGSVASLRKRRMWRFWPSPPPPRCRPCANARNGASPRPSSFPQVSPRPRGRPRDAGGDRQNCTRGEDARSRPQLPRRLQCAGQLLRHVLGHSRHRPHLPGPVSVVSQSGAYGSHITHLARQRGLGISHWVTTGNECDIDVAEALRWVVEQDGVNVVMAYAEGIRNRDAFIDALETRAGARRPSSS